MANSKLYLVNILNSALLKNAEHVQYHTNIMTAIEGADAESVGLSSLVYDPYVTAIETEQDIVYNASGSHYTELMQQADTDRCTVYRRIFRKLSVCEVEIPDSVAGKAWPVISKNLIDPYGLSVCSLPLQEKTAVINGFVLDCREILTEQQIAKVNIDGDLDDLAMANQQFTRYYQERVAEKDSKDASSNSAFRATTDECFKHLYTMLNALANNPDPEKAAQTAAAVELVKKINVITEDARQRVTYRLKANKAFIDKRIINGDEELSLPLPMEEVTSITLEGNKLTVDNVKVTVLEKGKSGLSNHRTFTVAEFCDRYDGVAEVSKDEDTGVETMVISAFDMGAYQAVTIESIDING